MRLTDLVTPLKPLEAMAQGSIVVASDVGGHRELLVDGKRGYLVPADDVEALTAKLAEVLDCQAEWPARGDEGRRFCAAERHGDAAVARNPPTFGRGSAACR